MLVVLVLAAVTVIAGVTVVAMGRGGELSEFAPDVPPLDLPAAGQLSAVDFMALQLPVSIVGYHTQSVDETLNRVANALSERDTRIAVLEQRVSELLSSRLQARQEVHASPLNGPRTEHEPEEPKELAELKELPEPPGSRYESSSSPESSYGSLPEPSSSPESRSASESWSESESLSSTGSPYGSSPEPSSSTESRSGSSPDSPSSAESPYASESEAPESPSEAPAGSFGAWTAGERLGKEESR
ncbi:hypothetical protein [Streptosporangium sp. 'caverna']|uniref:hypothetical protein n=1 Tax=Streptosporangium sp. 'caverna' TaxID=2202249 RepID=UPI000D7D2BA8|nr:hypothetical protein [Streptosporangium sp. 'caverna']AWS46698.1 hypothetical protein DKM19_40790 [Streptosporangium sp. 'caverna']